MTQITSCGPGLLIGIPTLGRPVPLAWAMKFKALNPPINYNTNYLIVHGKPVADAREEICETALEQNHKYVFFLGDDTEPCSLNTMRQLIFRMEQNNNIGVVGAVYCSKSDPPAPLVFKENGRGSYWDWKVGEFFKVSGLGMDCTLIRTDVLRKMSKPWFKTVDEDNFAENINKADQWTEDLYFCDKMLKETEFEVWCDGSLLCNHWDVYAGKSYNLPPESKPMLRKSKAEKSLTMLDIGCGPANIEEMFPDYNIVRADIREDVKPDYVCDIRLLPFASEEFDLVYSSHVLEHFGRKEWKGVLREWLRVQIGRAHV